MLSSTKGKKMYIDDEELTREDWQYAEEFIKSFFLRIGETLCTPEEQAKLAGTMICVMQSNFSREVLDNLQELMPQRFKKEVNDYLAILHRHLHY
jgi:hypothetical protein